VHPANPRYFTDDTGKAIYLGGHQIFVDLQDNSFNKEFTRGWERTLDWEEHLDFMKERNLNYLRNWIIWSAGSGANAAPNKVARPMMYKRTGPGNARDGGKKFDLYKFDQEFFDRMRDRLIQAQDKGIYVSIMLFELYGFGTGEGTPPNTLWGGNMFNKDNNINNIHVDDDNDNRGMEFFSLKNPTVVAIQKDYIRKVVDTVNDLDNVFYEICNEGPFPSVKWQYEMIRFLKDYEATKPKQHLVMMSPGGRVPGGNWRWMTKESIISSDCDCFSVASGGQDWGPRDIYKSDPPVDGSGKPAIIDTDHTHPGSTDYGLPWKGFTRGYHFNLFERPFELPETEDAAWERMRYNVGYTVVYANKVDDLAEMNPRNDLCTTTYCLANPGEEYIIFQPDYANFTVYELQPGEKYKYEWLNTSNYEVTSTGETIPSSASEEFAPSYGNAVLFLRKCMKMQEEKD
jgi:hypothetical protein